MPKNPVHYFEDSSVVGEVARFLETFRDVVISGGWTQLTSPTDMAGGWKGFVAQCEEGYSDNIYEFRNDLSVRNLIEEILGSPDLAEFQHQFQWIRAEVDTIDERYRQILLEVDVEPGKPWWEARIPRLAGEELAADFLSRYGVSVEVVN